jgi:hypothetical protein
LVTLVQPFAQFGCYGKMDKEAKETQIIIDFDNVQKLFHKDHKQLIPHHFKMEGLPIQIPLPPY